MRVLVTGASGWIGSAVVPELLAAGHQVVGLARSADSAVALTAAGADVVRGDLDDTDGLSAAAAAADGIVHLAYNHDFTSFSDAAQTDARAVAAMGDALAGSDRPLVIASGTAAVPGHVSTERDETTASGLVAARLATARATRALADRGVRSVVVGLPRTVHGQGDHGFVAALVEIARRTGVAGYVGDGSARWPAVHRSDAARLFRLALENAPAGTLLHAVGDEGVATREIAEAIGRHLGLPTASMPPEHFGFLGGILAVDQPASSALTQELLDWHPTGPSLLDDLEAGHYTR